MKNTRRSTLQIGWRKVRAVALLCLLTIGGQHAAFAADAGITPSTVEVVPYQAGGYRYSVINYATQATRPNVGFEQPEFNDSAWSAGGAGMGSGGYCDLQSTRHSDWPVGTEIYVRRKVIIPAGATNVRIMAAADNDILAYFDGVSLDGTITHEDCPVLDEFRLNVEPFAGPVTPGEHTLAFYIKDRGVQSFFDMRLLVDVVRSWSVDTPIGQGVNAQGNIITNGRMTAPQDQTVAGFVAKPIFVAPGALVPCVVEAATDVDHWTNPNDGTKGTEADTIADSDYVWTGGDFITGPKKADGTYPTSPSVTGTSATLLAPQTGSATPTCTISNNNAKQPGTGESGNRQDTTPLVRSVVVNVTSVVASLQVVKMTGAAQTDAATGNQYPDQYGDAGATIGGTVYPTLVLDIGQGLKISSSSATVRVHELPDTVNGVTHPPEQDHVDLSVDFTKAVDANNKPIWERYYDPDGTGPQQLDWWPAPQAPSAADTASGPARYRCRLALTTTSSTPTLSTVTIDGAQVSSMLLGHNGAHEVTLSSVNGVSTGTINATPSASAKAPATVSVDVENLVITDVSTNNGTDLSLKAWTRDAKGFA